MYIKSGAAFPGRDEVPLIRTQGGVAGRREQSVILLSSHDTSLTSLAAALKRQKSDLLLFILVENRWWRITELFQVSAVFNPRHLGFISEIKVLGFNF